MRGRCTAVLVVALAACGGGAAMAPVGVSSPEATPTASPSDRDASAAPPPPTSGAAPSPSATAIASAASPPTSLAPAEMKGPIASALGADLTALGLDPTNLPPIERIEPRALRGVMKLIARSLGARCDDCHTVGDFAAPTRRKKIAARMWNEFAAGLTLADGSPLFCDSCHQGRIKLLDRSDKKALGKWMQASFVDGIKRKDGQAQKCESCHVDWNMTFLSTWAR